jgi:hypothetical protein
MDTTLVDPEGLLNPFRHCNSHAGKPHEARDTRVGPRHCRRKKPAAIEVLPRAAICVCFSKNCSSVVALASVFVRSRSLGFRAVVALLQLAHRLH